MTCNGSMKDLGKMLMGPHSRLGDNELLLRLDIVLDNGPSRDWMEL